MRKRLPICLSLILLVMIVLCQVAFAQQKGTYAGKTLRVATWGGKWRDTRDKLVGQPLEKATGAKVEWVVGNPVNHLAKMIAAKGGDVPFDVAEMGSIETVKARELGLLAKLDRNLAPNINNVLPEIVGGDWVGMVAVEYVNIYIPSKFKEMGLAPPARYEDLFHPKLAGRIGLPFIGGSIVGPRFLISLAIEEGGSFNNIKPALDRLKRANVSYYYRATSELEMRLLAHEVLAAYGSVTRPFLHWRNGKDVDYVSVGPGRKKATVTISNVVITEGSKNKELAHIYVNHALGLNAQYGMAEWGGVRPVTKDGLEKIRASSSPTIRRIADIPWKDVFSMDLPPDVETAAKNLENWVDQFNREVGVR